MNKLSRRDAFAAAAGGAVAAATAKRDVNAKPLGAPPAYYGGEAKQTVDISEREWRLTQIARAKRLAAGDFQDEDRNYPTDGQQCPYQPLRSVSDAARWYMRDRRYARQWEQRTIKAALDALEHYDNTGILRTIF
jgi:hypothetical protein